MIPFGGVLATDSDPLGVVQEAVERWGMAGSKFHPMVGFELDETTREQMLLRTPATFLERYGRRWDRAHETGRGRDGPAP